MLTLRRVLSCLPARLSPVAHSGVLLITTSCRPYIRHPIPLTSVSWDHLPKNLLVLNSLSQGQLLGKPPETLCPDFCSVTHCTCCLKGTQYFMHFLHGSASLSSHCGTDPILPQSSVFFSQASAGNSDIIMQSDLTVLYPLPSHLSYAPGDLYSLYQPHLSRCFTKKTIGLLLHILLTSLSLSCCSNCKQLKNAFSSLHLTLWEKVSSRYTKKTGNHSCQVLFVHREFGVRHSLCGHRNDKQRYRQIVQENNVPSSWTFSKRERMRTLGLII